jgi:diamine N-acetyltransferase
MTITVATKDQMPIVQELAAIIWPETYGAILSVAQFDYMMDMMYSINSLEKQLENNKIFLLIEHENTFVGFASYELNIDNSNTTKIHKLYVLPKMQGKGLGKKLIHFITEIAIATKNETLTLCVNKYNKAKDFYLNNGFEITDSIVFDIGNGYVMDDYVMKKKLILE